MGLQTSQITCSRPQINCEILGSGGLGFPSFKTGASLLWNPAKSYLFLPWLQCLLDNCPHLCLGLTSGIPKFYLTSLPHLGTHCTIIYLIFFLQFDSFFFFFFWPHWAACGLLAPRPGIKPRPPAVEAQSPNHWTTREFPDWCLLTAERFLFCFVGLFISKYRFISRTMKSKICSLSLRFMASDIKTTPLSWYHKGDEGIWQLCLFLYLYLAWFQQRLEALQQVPGS